MKTNRDIIIGAIRACPDRTSLEDTFKIFKIKDYQERYDILVEAMYTPEMFFSNENPLIVQKYELALELFLTMEWKITATYQNLGIGK